MPIRRFSAKNAYLVCLGLIAKWLGLRSITAAIVVIGTATPCWFSNSQVAAQEKDDAAAEEDWGNGIGEEQASKIIELPVALKNLPKLNVKLDPINPPDSSKKSAGGGDGGGIAGTCPPITVANTTFDWSCTSNCTVVIQAGVVETEIAAATYSVPAAQFPIRLDTAEMIFATSNAAVQTTTQWSILVWDGPPNTGILVAEFSSDGKILPHIIMPPGSTGVNVQVSVDPKDPKQIFIYNDSGTNKFSVGYRIDDHSNEPISSCFCVPQFPQFGTLPAVCCPPLTASNAFPATDANGLSNPSSNWLYARNCPGATGFCQADEGWHTSGSIGISHDWVIRATYTPINCGPAIGSCCLPGGTCLNALTATNCVNQGGVYQGDGTDCASTNCPVASGACCINSSCSIQTQPNCVAQGGTFIGANTTCNANSCKGACCVPSTGNCTFVIQPLCSAGGGLFQGVGVQCGSIVCFPIGACCLPSGVCVGGLSPDECRAKGGAFQGHATACLPNPCPIPEGACCLGKSCFGPLTQDDCEVGFGGVWLGPDIECDTQVCAPQCVADIAPPIGDGVVDVDDLLLVINSWGSCPPGPPPPNCPADISPDGGNGEVNVDDLLAVINAWGPCE